MNKTFFEDFEDFIRLLTKYEVEYLVVGGYAISIYSRPKNTEDISLKDLTINKKKSNRIKDINDLSWLKEYGKSS